MTIPKHMSGALSENLLTLLSYSDEHGKFVARVLDPQLFEGDMRIMAERIIGYWRTEKEAPKHHTFDLFADILEDRGNKRAPTFRRTLSAMLQLAQGINAEYVMSQLKTFIRMQKLKDAIFRSAEILNQAGETTIQDVETILSDILKARDFLFDGGVSLEKDFDILLDYLKTHYQEFSTGIPLFNKYDVTPSRGTLFLLLGASGAGKTWGMVHLGVEAWRQRKKVLHITPELSAEDTMLRYYMTIFGASKRSAKSTATILDIDDQRLVGMFRRDVKPSFGFEGPDIREELMAHIARWNSSLNNIRIKRFAPRTISAEGLDSLLDSMEDVDGFSPDMLIVDSAYLLKLDSHQKEYRLGLGRSYERLRTIAVDRNISVVASHQLSKQGATARRASYTHIAEDWSIIQTADIAITHSATKAEEKYGLARLYADKVRNDKGNLAALITQNYSTGAYVLKSVELPENEYWEMATREFGEEFDRGGEDEEEDD